MANHKQGKRSATVHPPEHDDTGMDGKSVKLALRPKKEISAGKHQDVELTPPSPKEISEEKHHVTEMAPPASDKTSKTIYRFVGAAADPISADSTQQSPNQTPKLRKSPRHNPRIPKPPNHDPAAQFEQLPDEVFLRNTFPTPPPNPTCKPYDITITPPPDPPLPSFDYLANTFPQPFWRSRQIPRKLQIRPLYPPPAIPTRRIPRKHYPTEYLWAGMIIATPLAGEDELYTAPTKTPKMYPVQPGYIPAYDLSSTLSQHGHAWPALQKYVIVSVQEYSYLALPLELNNNDSGTEEGVSIVDKRWAVGEAGKDDVGQQQQQQQQVIQRRLVVGADMYPATAPLPAGTTACLAKPCSRDYSLKINHLGNVDREGTEKLVELFQKFVLTRYLASNGEES